jgi:hypothetical protein
MTVMEKHPEIAQLLDWLRDSLGSVSPQPTIGNRMLTSIGLSAMTDPSQLSYVRAMGSHDHFSRAVLLVILVNHPKEFERIGVRR